MLQYHECYVLCRFMLRVVGHCGETSGQWTPHDDDPNTHSDSIVVSKLYIKNKNKNIWIVRSVREGYSIFFDRIE